MMLKLGMWSSKSLLDTSPDSVEVVKERAPLRPSQCRWHKYIWRRSRFPAAFYQLLCITIWFWNLLNAQDSHKLRHPPNDKRKYHHVQCGIAGTKPNPRFPIQIQINTKPSSTCAFQAWGMELSQFLIRTHSIYTGILSWVWVSKRLCMLQAFVIYLVFFTPSPLDQICFCSSSFTSNTLLPLMVCIWVPFSSYTYTIKRVTDNNMITKKIYDVVFSTAFFFPWDDLVRKLCLSSSLLCSDCLEALRNMCLAISVYAVILVLKCQRRGYQTPRNRNQIQSIPAELPCSQWKGLSRAWWRGTATQYMALSFVNLDASLHTILQSSS